MLSHLNTIRKAFYMAFVVSLIAIGLFCQQADTYTNPSAFQNTENDVSNQLSNKIPSTESANDAVLFHTWGFATLRLRLQQKKRNARTEILSQQLHTFFTDKSFTHWLPVPKPSYYLFLFRYTLF